MNDKDLEAFSRVNGWFTFLKLNHESIFKIISLVQDNKVFFNVKCGECCLKKAAEKLEEIISEDQKHTEQAG